MRQAAGICFEADDMMSPANTSSEIVLET